MLSPDHDWPESVWCTIKLEMGAHCPDVHPIVGNVFETCANIASCVDHHFVHVSVVDGWTAMSNLVVDVAFVGFVTDTDGTCMSITDSNVTIHISLCTVTVNRTFDDVVVVRLLKVPWIKDGGAKTRTICNSNRNGGLETGVTKSGLCSALVHLGLVMLGGHDF